MRNDSSINEFAITVFLALSEATNIWSKCLMERMNQGLPITPPSWNVFEQDSFKLLRYFLSIMPVIERQINEREDDILREPINNENKEESDKDIDYLLEKIIGPAGK